MSGPLSAFLLRARDFLLEPPTRAHGGAPASQRIEAASAGGLPPRPLPAAPVEVAVAGLAPGCGTSTTAAGLAHALAGTGRPVCLISFDPGGPGGEQPAGVVVRTSVPAVLDDPGEAAAYGATAARLTSHDFGSATPSLVWDVAAREAARGSVALAGAEVVVALAPGTGEPALAGLVREALADRHGRVLLACSRPADVDSWLRWADACLPEARLGSSRIMRGRPAGGALGAALGELAALIERRAQEPTSPAKRG